MESLGRSPCGGCYTRRIAAGGSRSRIWSRQKPLGRAAMARPCWHGSRPVPEPKAVRRSRSTQRLIAIARIASTFAKAFTSSRFTSASKCESLANTPRRSGSPGGMHSLGPVKPRERLVSLDILRGIALLGVLLGNLAHLYSGFFLAPQPPDGAGDFAARTIVWFAKPNPNRNVSRV